MNTSYEKVERAILVGLDSKDVDFDIESSLDELEDLALAAGAQVEIKIWQNKENIDPSTYIGRGKAKEIKAIVDEMDLDLAIFNDELSGSQLRNLTDIIGVKILDRTSLILDIFAARAKTNEGMLQVKLAQLKYRSSRLSGMGKFMSRTGGGIGTRGPGEQKLETDRRHIQEEIKNIEKKLDKVSKNRKVSRTKRLDSNIPIVALTGYTNSGKSTLVNELIKTTNEPKLKRDVYVEDMVFATLDTSLRRAQFKNGEEFLLIDTVGFISKLPTHLVEAFKSTLEEIKYADLIVHLVDISSQEAQMHIQTTNSVLKDLEVLDKEMIYAFNKIDKVENPDMSLANKFEPSVFISAKNGYNIDLLLDMIYEILRENTIETALFFDYESQDSASFFLDKYKKLDTSYTKDGVKLNGKISKEDYNRYIENVISDV